MDGFAGGDASGRRKTAHEYVRDTLRQAIVSGALPAGERLVQSTLADRLRVSTTPVREALRDLATEGLVRLDPHRGATVTQLSFDEIQEVQHLCGVLEPVAMRRVVELITTETIGLAQDLVDAMAEERDVAAWADLNRRFHTLVVSDLDGTRTHAILAKLHDAATPYVALSLRAPDHRFDDANRDHEELLVALRERDAARAGRIALRHTQLAMEVLERSKKHFEGMYRPA